MGRTIPSITQKFFEERAAYTQFRRVLERSEQEALDELFAMARQHLAPAAYAAGRLPMQIFLLSMLLEEHKEVLGLLKRIEEARSRKKAPHALGAGHTK